MASPSHTKYDVFLSFRGEDTRFNFISHLYKVLLQHNIETYIDDEKLERGDEISPALLSAIEESQISVVIFSENYASSSWCLDELVHILRCRKRNKQIVLPVFYHVNPSDVRKQSGSFGVAFAKLEQRFKDRMHDKLNHWRAALTAAADLSGFPVPIERSESQLIEKIVKDVLDKLRPIWTDDHSNRLVGIDKHIVQIEPLLITNSSNNRIIGIWGMGGIGKTTLARAAFNSLYNHFEGYCFLENVSEEWQKHGRIDLRNKFFVELLEENQHVVNMKFARDRLRRKRVLSVLDDSE